MESIETLNQRLIEHYGVDESNRPMFRIVWAEDQTEKRLVMYTDSGMQLLTPEIREVKKYTYLKGVYALERLVLVDEEELPGITKSYEPIWVYRSFDNRPLPPIWDATKVVIDVLYAALGKKSIRKYVEDVSPEKKAADVAKMQEELFGNETNVGDALAYKTGIVVPGDK